MDKTGPELTFVCEGSTRQPPTVWNADALLEPVSIRQFVLDYWGKLPLRIIRNSPIFFQTLMSAAELEPYLSLDDFFQRGLATMPGREAGGGNDALSSLSALFEGLRQGRSLRLRRLETFLHPLSPAVTLFRSMETALQQPKGSLSCYLTPSGAAGLGPHHDETEIFTLQITGSKFWRIYNRVDSDVSQVYEPGELGTPSQEFLLEPGDLFYLPRGYIHHVTNEQPSFSLTAVFEPFAWSNLLDLLVSDISRTSAFMAPLPAGTLHAGQQSENFQREFDARVRLIHQAIDGLRLRDLVDKLAARHLTSMSLAPDRKLASILEPDQLTSESWLERRSDVVARLLHREDRVVMVLPGGHTVQASPAVEPALTQILGMQRPFQVTELHHSLALPARIVLASKLVDCGVLRMVAGGPEMGI